MIDDRRKTGAFSSGELDNIILVSGKAEIGGACGASLWEEPKHSYFVGELVTD